MWGVTASALSGAGAVSSILERVKIKYVKRLVHDVKVGEIDLATPVEGSLNIDVAPQIGFWEGCEAVKFLPVIPTLESLANEVLDVIKLFRPDFP